MGTLKLLVLSSKPEIRDEVASLFGRYDVAVDYAEDHIQAVSLLAKTPYRGFVIEEGYLGVSGADFSKRIKSKLADLTIFLLVRGKNVNISQHQLSPDGVDRVISYPWKRGEAEKIFLEPFSASLQRLEEENFYGDRYVLSEEADQDHLDADVVKVIIKGIEDLPPLPEIVQKILGVVNDEDAGAKDLARIINSEPSLTAKILKITNSSFYGLKQHVTTISHAVVILGFNEVKNLVLGYSIFSNLLGGKEEERKTGLGFWRHNITCGVASRMFGERLGYKNPEELFVVGLLHDIGKKIFWDYFTDRYREVVHEALKKRRTHYEEERESLGLTHAEVGFWLAEQWNLPVIIRDGIRFHHTPSLAKRSSNPYAPALVSIVCYADTLSKLLGIGDAGDPFVKDVQPPGRLEELDLKGLAALGEEIVSQVKVFEQSLGIFSEQTWLKDTIYEVKRKRLFIIDDAEGVSPLEIILALRGIVPKRFPASKKVYLDMFSSASDILLLRLREDSFYPKFIERLYRENPSPPPVMAFTREPMLSDRGRGIYFSQMPYNIREFWEQLASIAKGTEKHES